MRKRIALLTVLVVGAVASALLAAGAQSRTVIDRPQAVTASGTVTLSGWSVSTD